MEKKEIKLTPTLDVWMITRLMQLVDKDYMNCTKNLPDTAQTEAFLEEVNKFPNQFSEIGKTVIIRNRLQDMMNVYNDSVITVKLQKNREGNLYTKAFINWKKSLLETIEGQKYIER